MYTRNQVWGLAPSIIRQLHERNRAEGLVHKPPRSTSIIRKKAAAYASTLMTDARSGGYGGIVVLPISGILSARGDWCFMGSVCEDLIETLRFLGDSPNVSSIVLDVNSPGGEVYLVPETAAVVAQVAEKKPVIAVANALMASAAYWIGSQATEVVITPSGEVGSVGVYAAHVEYSKADEEAGVAVTIVAVPRFKSEGNDAEPLTDEGKRYMEEVVESIYESFIDAVAAGRGISRKTVREEFGEGRTMLAKDARAAGLVDRIATLEEVVGALASKERADGERRAMAAKRKERMRAGVVRLRQQTSATIRECKALYEKG